MPTLRAVLRSRRVTSIGAAVLGGALLTGCTGIHPGAAVTVGDHAVPMAEVNEFVDALCRPSVGEELFGGQQLPRAMVRQSVAQWFAVEAMADVFASANGVDLPPRARSAPQAAKQVETVFSGEPDADELVDRYADLSVSGELLNEVILAVGAKELGLGPDAGMADQGRAGEAGGAAFTTWLAGTDISFDPRLDLRVTDSEFQSPGSAGSVALSPVARAEQREKGSTEGLTANQRCG